MDYSEFLEYVRDSIKKIVGDDCEVKIHTVLKNNDSEFEALVITTKELEISPTIYLKDFYDDYVNGKPIASVIADIYSMYNKHKISDNIDMSFFKNYDMVKPTIAFKLINIEKNTKLLEEIPYFRYLDLAIVFYCTINTETISHATTLIRHEHLKMWNKERAYILEDAVRNTAKLFPYKLIPLNQMMNEILEEVGILSEEKIRDIKKDEIEMYVLTNSIRSNGAVCIIYDDVLKEFSQSIDADLIIIPSSVHEVIIIPKRKDMSEKIINEMVKRVNSETLKEYEVLSDHIYLYSKEEDRLLIPGEVESLD